MQKCHNISPRQKSTARDMALMVGDNGPAFPLKKVAHAILSVDFRSLTPHALDDAEDLGAVLIAAVRKEALRRSPLRQVLGWDRQGPTLINGGETFDHKYILCSGEGRKKYVSEPYQFAAAGIHELLELHRQGWEIEIKAGDAMHFPGHTLSITFERQASDSAQPTALQDGDPNNV